MNPHNNSLKVAYHYSKGIVMIRVEEVDRYRVISHTRTLFRNRYSRERVVTNIHYNYGEDCPFIADALEEYDRLEAEQRKKDVLSEITAATAQGMIDGLVADGSVDLPANYSVKGTDTGRVIFVSHSPKWSINTPLNYLRVRLIKRFPKRFI